MRPIRAYFFSFILLLVVQSHAQVNFTAGIDTPAVYELISQPGLTISNITIHCDNSAYGEFKGNSELPMTHGLFLSTGNATSLFSSNDAENTTTSFGTTDTIPNFSPMNDVCSIEFDAQSPDSTIQFIFSFGSEEYPEYVNSSFNDVFAILVQGPNPFFSGNYNNLNIAYLPDSSSTCINHVNTQQNMNVFYDNTYPHGTFIEYDGLTTWMIATVSVFPDSVYHFTFVIGDQDDPFFDSGGFIAAQDSDNHALPALPEAGIDCYPNPVTDELYWMPRRGLSISSAILYDEIGRVVYVVEDPSEQRSIDMSQYAKGIYVLEIETTFFAYRFKVVKM